MHLFITVVFIQSLFFSTEASVCEDNILFIKDPDYSDVKISDGNLAVKTNVVNAGECSIKCSRFYTNCTSFFYNKNSKTCRLNSKIYVSSEGSELSAGNVYYREKTECSASPTVSSGHLITSVAPPAPTATQLLFDCIGGYIANNYNNKFTCLVNGEWSPAICNPIRSCTEVKRCNNAYVDGEYWIYPQVFQDQRVKIYCHNMSGTPSEFLSLVNPNVGVYPNLKNADCNGESAGTCSGSEGYVGETNYLKVKLNIQTMEIIRDDKTFVNLVSGAALQYGEANDCYSIHYGNNRASCGPKGTFTIDVSGTGLQIDPLLNFKFYGWNHWGEAVRNTDNTKIDLLCGGWSGGCYPNGTMLLKLKQSQEPAENTAVVPTCVYS